MNTHQSVLRPLVDKAMCKPGWQFELREEEEEDGSSSLRLIISVSGKNSRNPDQILVVNHYFPVPEATYNMKSWRRWLFEMCLRVENHEMSEWFRIGEERPFAPLHGPGEDPYTIHEFRDVVDANTNQDGSINK